MLSHTKKFMLIFFLVLIIPGISFSQNRQNKYYNPIRISVSALTKFVIESNDHPTDNYQFDTIWMIINDNKMPFGNVINMI